NPAPCSLIAYDSAYGLSPGKSDNVAELCTTRRLLIPLINPPDPKSPLFPYTTLFRSISVRDFPHRPGDRRPRPPAAGARHGGDRSEEYTSELQSLAYFVCRLLLVKKEEAVLIGSDIAVTAEQEVGVR